MAVQSAIIADGRVATARQRPIDNHGKERYLYSKFSALAAQADIGSTFQLGVLPPGAVRVLPCTIRFMHSAWGAGALLSFGHDAYRNAYNQPGGDPVDVVLNAVAFSAAQDFSAAVVTATQITAPVVIKYDIMSQAGVLVIGRATGANVPAGATMECLIGYLYE